MPPQSVHMQPAARTPSITSLRCSLDYGDRDLPRCIAFRKDVAAFHKTFLTSHGTIDKRRLVWGRLVWGRHKDRAVLITMCDAFLKEKGDLYWPADSCSTNYNRLQYSHNREQYVHVLYFSIFHCTMLDLIYRLTWHRIKESLEQLFFLIHNQHCYYKKHKQKQRNPANQAHPRSLQSPGKRTNTPSSTMQPPLTGRPTAQRFIQGSQMQREVNFKNRASRQVSTPTVPFIQSEALLAEDLSVEGKYEFIFNLVFSHKPVYSARGWTPNLEFGNIGFHEVVAELALRQKDCDMHNQLVGFLLTVEGPGLYYVAEVSSNDLTFKCRQKHILKVIKGQLRGSSTTGPLVYEVDIEPIRSEKTVEN